MSKITNDGLTRSGTGCFLAVPIWQQWPSKGHGNLLSASARRSQLEATHTTHALTVDARETEPYRHVNSSPCALVAVSSETQQRAGWLARNRSRFVALIMNDSRTRTPSLVLQLVHAAVGRSPTRRVIRGYTGPADVFHLMRRRIDDVGLFVDNFAGDIPASSQRSAIR